MNSKILSGCLFLALTVFAPARQDFSKVEVKAIHVAENIYKLKEFYAMLTETSGIVEKAIADDKTLDQIKAEALPEKWKSWAVPTLTTERWLEILYRGLNPK